MTQTTVLLADLPPMLEDIVFHLLRDRADLRILRGSAADGIQAAAAANDTHAVIVERSDPTSFDALDDGLTQAAALSVLALKTDGSVAYLHRLQPVALPLEDISAAQLNAALATIRPATGNT